MYCSCRSGSALASREGQFMGDDLCNDLTRKGENVVFPVYPKSKIDAELVTNASLCLSCATAAPRAQGNRW